ncbi:MAG: ABC transporter permease subunit [Anaerolineales bacterium]|nr:ABC transporter permease subunit [Anaerolineales bacterium]
MSAGALPTTSGTTTTTWLTRFLLVGLVALGLSLAIGHWGLSTSAPALVESTPGQLSIWVADQTLEDRDDIESWLVWLTLPTAPGGELSQAAALGRARLVLALLGLMSAGLAGWVFWRLWNRPDTAAASTLWLILSWVALLLNVPSVDGSPWFLMVLAGLGGAILVGLLVPGRIRGIFSSLIIVAALLLLWELYKILGDATGNVLPLTDFPWKLPHWQAITSELLLPARRNGPQLLLRILATASLVTWSEALMGFTVGGLLGFGLGVLFAHHRLLERGLLPYVVASQTVPIIAIAPMIVAWLGQGRISVAVISAYLAFFPVTINTLRGLTSPDRLKLDLMRSYAASRREILWKLRFPAALPYIFTALKVASTACVVGAIVGELPSSRSDGLAAAILRASGNYASEPEKLWAAIIMAALVGILFFSLVSLAERYVLRGFNKGIS